MVSERWRPSIIKRLLLNKAVCRWAILELCLCLAPLGIAVIWAVHRFLMCSEITSKLDAPMKYLLSACRTFTLAAPWPKRQPTCSVTCGFHPVCTHICACLPARTHGVPPCVCAWFILHEANILLKWSDFAFFDGFQELSDWNLLIPSAIYLSEQFISQRPVHH